MNRNLISKHPEEGAALLIIVAILAIIAALSIGTRYFGGSTRQLSQKVDAKQAYNKFDDAIVAFYVQNSRFPCPADITLAESNANYGMEAAACTGTDFLAQVLPWKSLGLSASDVLDPYGNYYAYHVVPELTTADAPTCFVQDSGDPDYGQLNTSEVDGIVVKTADNSATNLTDRGLLVVISYGKNGSGAYTASKSLNAAPSADIASQKDEAENTDGDLTFVKTGTSGSTFDDYVDYWLPQKPSP